MEYNYATVCGIFQRYAHRCHSFGVRSFALPCMIGSIVVNISALKSSRPTAINRRAGAAFQTLLFMPHALLRISLSSHSPIDPTSQAAVQRGQTW